MYKVNVWGFNRRVTHVSGDGPHEFFSSSSSVYTMGSVSGTQTEANGARKVLYEL